MKNRFLLQYFYLDLNINLEDNSIKSTSAISNSTYLKDFNKDIQTIQPDGDGLKVTMYVVFDEHVLALELILIDNFILGNRIWLKSHSSLTILLQLTKTV